LIWFIAESNALELLKIFDLIEAYQEDSLEIEFTATNEAAALSPLKSTTDWLDTINHLRSASGLASVTENTSWSEACRLHSRYMVKTDMVAHVEEPDNPWYTPKGVTAASNSNVMASSDPRTPDADAIALWMSQPFHGIGILDPQLETVGFGSYREATGKWKMAATLDIASGNTPVEPPETIYPVMWPPVGYTMDILSYDGSEWPDPLTSCPGFRAPSGPPIYLQIGDGRLTPNVTTASLLEDGNTLEFCVFDETTYTNPGAVGEQEVGRGSLNARDGIILIPKLPLSLGATYSVSITSNDRTYTWSFTTKQ
jgi:hypothetical protein